MLFMFHFATLRISLLRRSFFKANCNSFAQTLSNKCFEGQAQSSQPLVEEQNALWSLDIPQSPIVGWESWIYPLMDGAAAPT